MNIYFICVCWSGEVVDRSMVSYVSKERGITVPLRRDCGIDGELGCCTTSPAEPIAMCACATSASTKAVAAKDIEDDVEDSDDDLWEPIRYADDTQLQT